MYCSWLLSIAQPSFLVGIIIPQFSNFIYMDFPTISQIIRRNITLYLISVVKMERTVVNCTPHFRLFSDSCQTARERCLQEFWSCCCISGYSKLPMQRLPFSFPSDDRSLPAQPHFSPQTLSATGSPCTSPTT